MPVSPGEARLCIFVAERDAKQRSLVPAALGRRGLVEVKTEWTKSREPAESRIRSYRKIPLSSEN